MKILEVGILDFLPMPWQMALIVPLTGIIVMVMTNLLIRRHIVDAHKRVAILLAVGIITVVLSIFTVGSTYGMTIREMMWNVVLLIPVCLVSPVFGKTNSPRA